VTGFHKSSVAYLSDGSRRFNQPFNPTPYGPPILQGDVIGVGYRPRSGTIFYTRNGKRLEDVVHGLKSQNFFPAIGANGPSMIHVNFGQAGFVFIEANVKKWGLAPMTGSLAPPPPYGSEAGSILLEAGRKDGMNSPTTARGHGYSQSMQTYTRHSTHLQDVGHTRTRSGNYRSLPPTSPGPMRSPTEISLAHLVPTDDIGEPSASGEAGPGATEGIPAPGIGLGLHDSSHPPPEYSSPDPSDAGDDSRRSSSESGRTPLIQLTRSRGNSSATVVRAGSNRNSRGPTSPPIPSYFDAVQQGASRERSDSTRSTRSSR
jgi:hypothetical protein